MHGVALHTSIWESPPCFLFFFLLKPYISLHFVIESMNENNLQPSTLPIFATNIPSPMNSFAVPSFNPATRFDFSFDHQHTISPSLLEPLGLLSMQTQSHPTAVPQYGLEFDSLLSNQVPILGNSFTYAYSPAFQDNRHLNLSQSQFSYQPQDISFLCLRNQDVVMGCRSTDHIPAAQSLMYRSLNSGYRCGICNEEFPTHQAFGGHMSSHSKAKKARENAALGSKGSKGLKINRNISKKKMCK